LAPLWKYDVIIIFHIEHDFINVINNQDYSNKKYVPQFSTTRDLRHI